MAMTFAETFIRAYAERAVKAIQVTCDKESGVTLLTFHGRHQQVNMRDLVLQEEAFARLGLAVNALLCIPDESLTAKAVGEPVQMTQLVHTESST